MNDDWRLRIDLHDHGLAHRLGEMLAGEELEHDLERSFGDRVVVSVDDSEVFCYAGSRAQAEAAEHLIGRLAAEHEWQADVELRHWHPVAEEWQAPEEPLPTTAGQQVHERAERLEQEDEESSEQGYPEMEVRVTCDSRHEARELSDRLEHEGIVNVHRWNWVLVGADDEDGANALAERLRRELPGKSVTVEPNVRIMWDNRPGNPFAVLGGLAG